jgi:uncharacterized BrkB/YihY/UPF0761 family membrane protein
MNKAAAIAGATMFAMVLVLSAGLSPLCAFCVPLLTGTLAGYLTGLWEKDAESVVRRGATAGALAGGIAIAGQLIASLINAAVMQNPEYQLNQAFGVPATEPTLVWVLQLGMACFVGLVNVGLAAALGAVGGSLWRSLSNKPASPSGPLGG